MASMPGKLYAALQVVGAPEDMARKTSRKSEVRLLKPMVGFTLAVQVARLFFIWQILLRLARLTGTPARRSF